MMNEVLHRHRLRIQEISALEKEVAQARTEIAILEQRRVVSLANHEKNRARTEYSNKLRMAYDVLTLRSSLAALYKPTGQWSKRSFSSNSNGLICLTAPVSTRTSGLSSHVMGMWYLVYLVVRRWLWGCVCDSHYTPCSARLSRC